jgi:hypothetical protein
MGSSPHSREVTIVCADSFCWCSGHTRIGDRRPRSLLHRGFRDIHDRLLHINVQVARRPRRLGPPRQALTAVLRVTECRRLLGFVDHLSTAFRSLASLKTLTRPPTWVTGTQAAEPWMGSQQQPHTFRHALRSRIRAQAPTSWFCKATLKATAFAVAMCVVSHVLP